MIIGDKANKLEKPAPVHCLIYLTPREKEVCFCLVKGLLNEDIAAKLGTTDATIQAHKAGMMGKMHIELV